MGRFRKDRSAAAETSEKLTPLEAIAVRYRYAVSVVVHGVLFAAALLLAYMVRFETIPATGEGIALAFGKSYTASGSLDSRHRPGAAFDGSESTEWHAPHGATTGWLEVDLAREVSIHRAVIREGRDCAEEFQLQYKEGDRWRTFYKGAQIGKPLRLYFKPISARFVRLNITSAAGAPNITDFQLFGKRPWFYTSFLPWLPFFVIVKLIIFGMMKLFRGGWLYASIRDVANILLASWIFAVIMLLLIVLFRWLPDRTGRTVLLVGGYLRSYPMGVLLLDFLGSVFLVCVARLAFRIYREELRPISAEGVRRVLIVGAGNAAETIVREINRMRVERYRVIGLVDDDPGKQHITMHGAPVLAKTSEIRQICEEHSIEEIIIAMPSATQKQMRRVIELCSGTKLRFQSLPGMGDLIDGSATVSQIRPVDINDLLGREAVELDSEALARFLRGRRVLITGAGGSIGSEMCRQVCNHGPTHLALVEQAENPLFEINGELAETHGDIPRDSVICDVYDRRRVMKVWEEFRPEVVIHAAAHKHVPLMERNPCEAIKNNVIGTKNVVDASRACDVGEFVLISTDKAVNPSSIMGACKRVGEIYTQAIAARPGCKTQFKAVRFGNVLGSAGSVVPTFRKQIADGGPVRVTHPEMTRYFMTIPEAAQLVLQAAATGTGGQTYLLNMGEPVKIVDLARQMITLSGFRPGEDIDIVFSGIRPGEKLFEELRTEGEDIQPTVHPKVLVWKSRPVDWQRVCDVMDELAGLRHSSDRGKIIAAIQRIVPEYKPVDPQAAQANQPSVPADHGPQDQDKQPHKRTGVNVSRG